MKRLYFVMLLLFAAFGLVTLRLFYWQVFASDRLVQAASDQYYFKLEIPSTRGSILDSEGNPLVTNTTAYLTYAEPKHIEDADIFSKEVAEILALDPETLKQNITQENVLWVPLKHKVDEPTQQKLTALQLKGIGFEKEGTRRYLEASMAAHLLGFVGSDENGDDKGYFGIEGYYDLALKGKAGSLIQEKDARGLPILLGDSKRIPAQNGHDLRLYTDRTVQFIIEEHLKKGIERYGAKSGLVAVMDPKTGGILGSASFPSFDPQHFTDYTEDLFLNPLISSTYEPGSTFKALVMAAALNERVIEPKTIYDENGPVKIGEYSIRTWNNEYHDKITMTEVLEKSSNPGMVFVGQKLGKDKLLNYIDKFGFGRETGIDLEGEEVTKLRDRSDWGEIDLATASFGQGIAVTPIQMLRAIGALANNGDLMVPRIVAEITDQTGKKILQEPKREAQVIRPATAKVITEMMIAAVDLGEAKWAKPPGYRIAGKTGTAQIPVAGHYDEEKTIASFVGFAPADDPKFVMLVLLREPTTSPWGSETAAPLFFNIAKELFTYYGISPK